MTKYRLTSVIRTALYLIPVLAGVLFSNVQKSAAETIAISIPLSGDFAELGRNFQIGAELAMEQIGQGHDLFIADDGCDPDLAQLAAKDIQTKNPAIATGFLCNESALVASNTLRESQIPLLIAGARSVRLIKDREREEWNLWRMAPGDDYASKTAAKFMIEKLKETPFAIVDDGTIYGRTMTDNLRLQLNEANMPPQFSDTFRAAQSTQAGLLRRLQRAGVSTAFIASATMEDLVIIAANLKQFKTGTEIIVSEQLATLPFMEDPERFPEGIKVVMEPPVEKRAPELQVLMKERDITPNRLIQDGYAAIQIVIEALGKDPAETTQNLSSKRFDTAVGTVEFNENGENIHNPYQVYRWDGSNLVTQNITNSL